MTSKEKNKAIVEAELAKEDLLKKTETAKEEFLRRLADLGLSAYRVSELLADMQNSINMTLSHRAKDIKLSDVLGRKVIS